MSGVRSPSRPRSRSRHSWPYWCCAPVGSARSRCRCAASTPHVRQPGWRRVATGPPRRRPGGSRRAGRLSRSAETVRSTWRGSASMLRCPGSPLRPRRRRPGNPACDDRGSASVIAVAMIAVLLVLTGGFGYLGAAVVARHRAQAAADLAALAGAGIVAAGPEAACEHAAQLARRMGGGVTSCLVENLDVVLTVEIAVALGHWDVGPARASARAGPVG